METARRKTTYRLYPNQAQEAVLAEILGLHCRAYNALLEEHKRRYLASEKSYSFNLMCKDLTRWRLTACSLGELNAQSLQVTAKRVSLAFKAFFRRCAAGETPGYPRFKSFHRYPGWGYKTHGDGWRLFETPQAADGRKPRSRRLRLSVVGDLKIRGKGRFSGLPKTCEILHKGGKWYASVTFVVAAADTARVPGTEACAFDWGLTTLLTIATADGLETVANPRLLGRRLAALANLQQKAATERSRLTAALKATYQIAAADDLPAGVRPASKKLTRLYGQIRSLHHKIANQRHDFYHKLTTALVARFGTFATEELDVTAMAARPKPIVDEAGTALPNGAGRKAKLNRSIHDAAPGKLLAMLRTKAEEAGSLFCLADTITVKPTQRCHQCGTLVKKELSEREHCCPQCGLICGRDENAALTLLRWLKEGDFWLGTSHCGPARKETPSIAAFL